MVSINTKKWTVSDMMTHVSPCLALIDPVILSVIGEPKLSVEKAM